MTERKEPTLSGIRPDTDEIARHQQRGAAAAKKRPPPRPVSAAQPVVQKSVAGVFGLLFALVAGGVAGYSVWQQMEMQKVVVTSEARIKELEARLNLTSDESNQSVTRLIERVETADSEIRKLWDTRNVNRRAISDNERNMTAVANNANDAKTLATEQGKTLKALRTSLNEQQLLITKLTEDLEFSRQQAQELLTQSRKAGADLEKLRNVSTQLAKIEEDIRAINAFRRSVNADILALKQQQGVSAPAP